MNLPKTLCRWLLSTVLMMPFLFLATACEVKSTPTPTLTPELSLDDLLSRVGEKLAALSTAKFKMVDEMESGAKFFGATFKSMEAEVKAPDSFRMLADVVNPSLGLVKIEMLAVGDHAYMKLFKNASWVPLPLDLVPFNFKDLGTTLRDLLPAIKDGTITGRESVLDAQTIRVEGNVASEELSSLITSVDSGHAVALTLWIDEAEHTLRQIRIAGQIYDDDAPETTRLMIIEEIDLPIDIQLPDIRSGP